MGGGGRDVSMQLFVGLVAGLDSLLVGLSDVVGGGGRGVSMQLCEGGVGALGGGGGGLFLPPTGVSLQLGGGVHLT